MLPITLRKLCPHDIHTARRGDSSRRVIFDSLANVEFVHR
jgi:hypothetical protein